MIAFLIVMHVICCLGLIVIVLLQAGKGAGLASTFGAQAVESALGAGASDFLKKATTVMAVMFMLTSLTLAFLTARRSASVIRTEKPAPGQSETVARQVRVTPEGKEVVEEKVLPGLEGKSKEELQKVLKEITEKLPLGQKVQTTATAAEGVTATGAVSVTATAQEATASEPATVEPVQEKTETQEIKTRPESVSQEPLQVTPTTP